jgi:hypothetical protein
MATSKYFVTPFSENVQHDLTPYVELCGTHTMGVGIALVPQGTPVGRESWEIKQDLVTELRLEGSNYIALSHDVSEYGIGETEQDALSDLVTSLADYRASLEKREATLATREKNDLARLRDLIG